MHQQVENLCLQRRNKIGMEGRSKDRSQNPDCNVTLPRDFIPGNWDVICSKGRESYDHVGNRRFRLCIKSNQGRYLRAKTKLQKSNIVRSIVESIRANCRERGGGFIRRDPESGLWYEVGEKIAREKVGQALRDSIKISGAHQNVQALEQGLEEPIRTTHPDPGAATLPPHLTSTIPTVTTNLSMSLPFLHTKEGFNKLQHQVAKRPALVSFGAGQVVSPSKRIRGSDGNVHSVQSSGTVSKRPASGIDETGEEELSELPVWNVEKLEPEFTVSSSIFDSSPEEARGKNSTVSPPGQIESFSLDQHHNLGAYNSPIPTMNDSMLSEIAKTQPSSSWATMPNQRIRTEQQLTANYRLASRRISDMGRSHSARSKTDDSKRKSGDSKQRSNNPFNKDIDSQVMPEKRNG